MKSISLVFIFIFSMLFAGYAQENNNPSNQAQKLKKIQLSIKNYTIEKFKSIGSYSGYSFGDLIPIKPKEILELDQLLSLTDKLPSLEENYGDKLDSVIAANDSNIALKKQEIRKNKIYHYYKIDHVFLIRDKKGKVTLYEIDFFLYPNLKIKDVTIELKTELTAEKKALFVYFIEQYPLIEDEDPYYQNYTNQKMHKQLSDALANAKENKEAVFHQVLEIVKFIRKYNKFDPDLFCAIQIKKWIKNNNKSTYKLNYRAGKFTRLKNPSSSDRASNFIMYHRFRYQSASSKMKQSALSFEFDANYLIVEIIEYKKDFDQFFD